MSDRLHVVVAPDSFKGSITATRAAAALAGGWRSARPGDVVRCLPSADGGEGTLDALATAHPDARRVGVAAVRGPGGEPVDGQYLLLPDGTAVVELAHSSGLPLLSAPAPLTATTRGVGEVLRAAVVAGCARAIVSVGGSASTDGGAGLLCALGLRVLDASGGPVGDGGAALLDAVTIDRSGLLPPPPRGVLVLCDVDNPLTGPRGAAAVFGPQKGAGADDVALLDRALGHWAALTGGDADRPGAGAAGGTAYGLVTLWGAQLVAGAGYVADAIGLDDALAAADLVIAGEGRFDATSLRGKVCGEVLARAARHGVPAHIVAGDAAAPPPPGVRLTTLAGLAGGVAGALADPAGWLAAAGACIAGDYADR